MAEGFTTPDAHHDAYLATFGASAAPATATAEAPEPIPSDAGSLLAPVQDPTAVVQPYPPPEASAPPLAGVYAQHDAPTAAPDTAPGALQPGGFLGQTDAELAAQKKKDIQGRMDQATGGDEAFTTPDDHHTAFLKQEEDAGVFHTPDEGNQAFIEQMANSRDDPLDLYAQDAITDLDTAAKIYKKKAEDFSKKDLGQKLKDEAYDLPDDVRRLAGAFAGGVASLPGMVVGGVQAGNQLWQLMPFSGSSADEKARAMRGIVAGGESIGQSASGMLNTVQQGIANTPILGSLMSDLTGKPMSAEEQKTLMDAGTPLSRPLDPKTATLDEVKQEALARKALADSAQKIQAGDVGPGGEAVLKFLAYDQTAPTVAQLEARGVPWQPMAVQGYNDIANTLALAVAPEVPVVGEASRLLGAKGLQYGGKAATALGFGGEKAADIGFKLGKWGLKLGSLGMLAIDHDDLLNPFALARLIKAAWMHPEAAAWVGGIAGAAKAVPWGLQYMGNIWTKAGADRLAGSSLLGQENILSQVIGRTSQSAAQGAAANVLYSLPFTQDPEQLAQAAGQGADIGSLLGMPGNVTQSGRSVAFDQPFTKPGMTPKDAPPPAPIDYGTDLTLDKASAQAIKGIPSELQTRVNGVKNMMNGKAEIYVLPDAEYDKKQAQGAGINGLSPGQIKSAGVMMTTGPNGTPQVFLRQGKVGEALYHETGHALWQYLPTDSQNAFTQAALAKGNPDAVLQRYTKDPTATASSLPTEADVRNGAPRGPGGFTQELFREEMGAEGFGRVLNGQTVDQLSKDPGVVRNMQFGLGRLLERLGVPTTTAESQSILGFQPHLTDGLVLDQFIRRQLAGATQNVRTPVTPAGQPAAATPASAPVPTGSPPAPVGAAPVAPAPSPGTIPGPQPAGAASGPPPPATAPPATAPPATAPPATAPPATAAVSPAATAPLPVAPVVPSVTPAALATARAEAIRGLKGLGFSLADAKAKVAASSGTTTQEILQDVLVQRGRGNVAPPPPAPPPTPSKLTAMPGTVPATPPVAAAPPPVNPAEQAYQDSLAAVVKNAAAREQESGTTTAVQTAPGPVVAPGVPETGTKEPATPATPVKVAAGDVQKAWNQQHPNFPSTGVTVDEQGNYHVRHAGGDEDILSPTQLADLGLKGSGAPVKGNTLAGATSAHQIDPTTAEARTTWFGLNPNGSNDLGDVDAHGRNLKGYFGDETHNPDVVGASLPWRTLAGTVGDFTRDPKLMEAIRKGDYKVRITAADGKTVDAKIVDVGPAEWTRAGLDITYGTGKALGLTDTTTTRFQVIGPDGKPLELRSAPRDWVPKGGQGAPGRSTGPAVEGETLPVRERHRRIEEAPGLEEPPAARRAPTGEATQETGRQGDRQPVQPEEETSPASGDRMPQTPTRSDRILQEQRELYQRDVERNQAPAPLSEDQVKQIVQKSRDAVATTTTTGKERSENAVANEQEAAGNQALLEAHAASLTEGDTRVQRRVDPDTGRVFVSGGHLVDNDPVHSHLLVGVPQVAIDHANTWSSSIDQGKSVTVTYRGATASEGSPVGEVRAKEYATDPAAARAKGESSGTEATKQILPLDLRITGVNTPGDKALILHGLSPDKLTQNFSHIRESLDAGHPAKAMSDEQFAQEVGKYIQNHAHGYRGDGTAALAGTEGVPVKVDPSYEPQLLGERVGGVPRDERQRVADAHAVGEVINGAFNSETAQGKGPKAERAIGLAEANQGYVGARGETNPLRERLNNLWTEKKLVSPFEDIRADNVIKFHGPSDKGPAAIRAQSSPVTKALETHGLPNRQYVSAGFMPIMGERATDFEKADREGRTFVNPADNRKRFEVSDKGMTFKSGFKEAAKQGVRLADAIDHPELFKNYPFLKDVTVKVDPSLSMIAAGNYEAGHLHDTGHGFAFTPGQINLSGNAIGKANAALEGGYKKTLVHEIQHAIQDHEGLSGGSNPQVNKNPLKGLVEYWNNPGEKEARKAEGRANLSQKQLDENPPYKRSSIREGNAPAPTLDPTEVQAVYDRLKSRNASGKVSPWDMARELGVDGQSLIEYFKANPMQVRSQKYVSASSNVSASSMPMMGEVPRTTSEESGTRAMFMPQVSGRQASEKVPKDIKGTPEAFPVKFHTSRTGSIVAQTIPYDLANSPISGKAYLKEVPNNAPKLSESDQKQFHYLSPDNQDRLANLDKKGVVSKLGDKVVNQVKQWESVPDVMAGKGWYSRLREKIQTHLGPNADLFSQLLGATSASNGAQQNFLDALQAYQLHQNGTYDRHVGLYQRGYQMMKEGTLNQHLADSGITEGLGMNPPETDAQALAQYISHHDITPLKENGKLYGQNSAAVLKVLAGTWLEQAEGPKTPNYAGNFSGRTLEATIDKWVARNLRRLSYEDQKRWRIQPQSESGVSDLDFAFGQKVMRNASEKLGMNPDDLQAIVWMGEKHEWEQRKWSDPGAAQDKVSYDEPFRLAFEGERPLTHEETRQALIAQKPTKEKKAPKASFMPVVSPMPHTVHIHFHGLPMPGVRRDNRDLIR